jgi:hypothetical protein
MRKLYTSAVQPAVSYCLGIFYYFCSAGHIGMASVLYPSKSYNILFLMLRSGCIYCLDIVSFCIQNLMLPLISLRFPSWSTMIYFDTKSCWKTRKRSSSMPCWFIIRISGSFPLIGADMLT